MLLEKLSFQVRIMLLIGAAVFSMAVLSTILIFESRERIEGFHIENAKTALAASLSILEEEKRQIVNGNKSVKEMKRHALSKLHEFRYANGEGYISILDDKGYVVMHPINKDIEHTNIWDFQDPTGAFITRDAINAAKQGKFGVWNYVFEHPVTGEQDFKTSVVGRFKPWGWTVIAGVFDSKVNHAVNNMFDQAFFAMLAMSSLFLVLALFIGRSLSRPIAALTNAMGAIADGKLDTSIPYQHFRNESGRMARALAVFRNSGREIIELQAEREKAQQLAEEQRLEMTTCLRREFGDVLEAASNGRFCSRVSTDLADDNLRQLSVTLNAFVGKVEAGVTAVKDGMTSMSRGEQPPLQAEDFGGAFSEMLQKVSSTAATIRSQAENLRFRAFHDTMTKLPNRRYFKEHLDKITSTSEQYREVALLHVDLDRFKQINDTLGHSAGDEVLKFTAASLTAAAREHDFVARIGGDEFIVLCVEDVTEEVVAGIANSIVEKLSKPYAVTGGMARFGASVGVAFGQGNLDCLFQNSDLALYNAKRNGRGQVAYFTENLRVEFVEAKQLSDDISRGLENGEFVPFFQPQFDAITRRIVGVEALARWHKPDGSMMPPSYFLPVAEEFNLLGKIDDQISRAAIKTVNKINGQGLHHIGKLSMNLSAERLADPDFIHSLDGLEKSGFKLSFELLESIMFDDQDEEFMMKIDELRDRGFDIEIDDFGSGRASITGLLKVSPKRLKIDQALIGPIVENEITKRLVETIIEMGRTLQIDVVAEGVETLEHANLLASMNCKVLQGYALSRPLPEQELVRLLAQEAAGLRLVKTA